MDSQWREWPGSNGTLGEHRQKRKQFIWRVPDGYMVVAQVGNSYFIDNDAPLSGEETPLIALTPQLMAALWRLIKDVEMCADLEWTGTTNAIELVRAMLKEAKEVGGAN